jgi:hypothetical protein
MNCGGDIPGFRTTRALYCDNACGHCYREKARYWRNPARFRLIENDRYHKNPTRACEIARRSYLKNRKKRCLSANGWRLNNREKVRAAKRIWAANHPGRSTVWKRQAIAELKSGYLKELLARGSGLSHKDFPSEIVETKREQIRLLRAIRKNPHENDAPNKGGFIEAIR